MVEMNFVSMCTKRIQIQRERYELKKNKIKQIGKIIDKMIVLSIVLEMKNPQLNFRFEAFPSHPEYEVKMHRYNAFV